MKLRTLGCAIVLSSVAMSGQAMARGNGHGHGHHGNGHYNKDKSFDLITIENLLEIATQEVIPTASTRITRAEDSYEVSITARKLLPGYVYSSWLLTFNHPEKCVDPCNCTAADLGNADVEGGGFWITSRVADNYGQVDLEGSADYGELPTGEDQILFAFGAEKQAQMTLVLREHGPASDDPATLEQQLTTHHINCGAGVCRNVASSFHEAPFCWVRGNHNH